MGRPVSRRSIIASIIRKDMVEWSRDTFMVAMTALVLVMFVALFYLLPGSVEETVYLGVYPTALADVLEEAVLAEQGSDAEAQGFALATFDSEDEMVAAIENREEIEFDGEEKRIQIGLAFPEDFVETSMAGEEATVRIYVEGDVPEELQGAVSAVVKELAYGVQAIAAGEDPEEAFPVTFPAEETIVVGTDMSGEQVPFKERLRPFFAFMIIVVEALALASLIAVEIQERTVVAMLVTPASLTDILTSKVIVGTTVATVQAVVILLLTQAFSGANVSALLFATLLGGTMAAAIGMLTGAAGKDFMGTLFYGMLFIIPLFIPAFAVLFPGSSSWIVRLIPSWGVIAAMEGASVYALSWSELAEPILWATAWCAVLLLAGWMVLRKKVQTL
jgi:ABC-2 type transport system permease protein